MELFRELQKYRCSHFSKMILFNGSQFDSSLHFLWSTFDLQSYEVMVITDGGQVTIESCCYERFCHRGCLIERCPNGELNFCPLSC